MARRIGALGVLGLKAKAKGGLTPEITPGMSEEDYIKQYGMQQAIEGVKDAKGFGQLGDAATAANTKAEARARLIPMPVPGEGRNKARKKAAKRRSGGRAGTILSRDRETLG